LVHIVPYAIRSGLAPTTAASILAAIGVFSFMGRIMWGILADRWGPKPAYVLAVFQQGLMMVWLLSTTHPVMFFLFAFFWGIGYGGVMPPYALFLEKRGVLRRPSRPLLRPPSHTLKPASWRMPEARCD
jgi:predicted MFS family arabinose efflux permease